MAYNSSHGSRGLRIAAAASLGTSGDVSIPASGGSTYGRQQQSPGFVMRGTLDAIGNAEAVDLGAFVMNDDAMWHPVLSDTEAHKAVVIPAHRCRRHRALLRPQRKENRKWHWRHRHQERQKVS